MESIECSIESSIGALKKLSEIKLFLIDLDGTIYLGDKILPGALNFISHLASSGKKYVFFTNNSSHSIDYYINKLNAMGFTVSSDNIISSTIAAIDYIKSAGHGRRVYPLGTPDFIREITDGGLIIDDVSPDYVLLAFDKTLTYEKIQRANGFLLAGIKYMAVNPDILCPMPDGPIPDVGAFMALFKASSGRVPDIIAGKPEKYMIEAVEKQTGLSKSEMAIIGDRIYTDMEMGRRAGLLRILVYSGETKPGHGSEEFADIAVDGVGSLVDMIKV